MAKVVQLQPTTTLRTPIGHAIRTGETSYRRLEDLHAEGRLPARAVIVDASKARFQREFIRSLCAAGADVTLDPKVAELSEVGKFRGSAKESPWAVDDDARPLEPEDFEPGAVTDLYGKFARMAAGLGVTSVMAPTHLLRPGVDNLWLPIDCRSVGLLRDALNREAGRHVAIDYPLILPHTRLLDDRYLPRILTALRGLPVDNLVVRLSGFGADAGALTVKRTLGAIEELQVLEYPILLDYVGGLVGLGALAFGIVSGIGTESVNATDSTPARGTSRSRNRARTVPLDVPSMFRCPVWTSRFAKGISRPSPGRRGAGAWSRAPIERVVRVD